jgi:hypothetical protein
MLEIDIRRDVPFFSVKAPLDGRDYLIRFEWNQRSGWYVALADDKGDAIFGARKAVCDWNLLRTCSSDRRPPGGLYLYDSTGTHEDPEYTDLGVRHKLYYLTADEVAAVNATQ